MPIMPKHLEIINYTPTAPRTRHFLWIFFLRRMTHRIARSRLERGYTNYYSVAITLLDRLLNLLRHGTCPPGIGDGRIGVRASRTFHRERQRREYSDENRERGRSIASGSIWSRYERSGSWHCHGTALEQPTPLTNNCMRTCVRTRLCQLLLLTDHQKTKDYIDPLHSRIRS